MSVDTAVDVAGRTWRFLGGAGFNVAAGVARAGAEPRLWSVVGPLTWERLAEFGDRIDLSGVEVRPDLGETEFALRYTESDRLAAIRTTPGAGVALVDLIRDRGGLPSSCHLSCREPFEPALVEPPAGDRTRFSLDFIGTSLVRQASAARHLLAASTLVFMNREELRRAEGLFRGVAATLVVTSAGEPIEIWRHDRLLGSVRPPATEPVEVTGAGDVLAGATIGAMQEGEPLLGAVETGVAWAAESLRGPGVSHLLR